MQYFLSKISLKTTSTFLLISYLASTAMMLSASSIFLNLLFLIGLFNLKGFTSAFTNDFYFRYFVLTILSVFILVTVSSLVYEDLDFLFTYKYEVFKELLMFPVVLFLLLKLKFTVEEIIKIILITASYALFYSFAVWYADSVRGVDLLSGAIHRGSLAVIYAILSLIIFFIVETNKAKFLALIGFISGMMLSFQTGSKGGWLAIVLVILSLGIYFYISQKERFKVYLLILIGFGFVITFLWSSLPIADRLESAYSGLLAYWNGEVTEGSVGPRLEMWKATLYGIQNSTPMELVFGRGFMSFQVYWQEYIASGLSLYNISHPHPHNDYLKIMFEFGFLGMFLFAAMFVLPIYVLVKAFRNKASHITYLFLGIILVEMILEFMLSDKVLFVKYLLHTYLLLISLIIFSIQNKVVAETPKELRRT